MKKSKIAIIDTGSANLHSVLKACKKVGTNVSITSNILKDWLQSLR